MVYGLTFKYLTDGKEKLSFKLQKVIEVGEPKLLVASNDIGKLSLQPDTSSKKVEFK